MTSEFFEKLVEHYARLASDPAWIDHARHQVMKLEKEPSQVFKGLGQAVKQRLEKQ
jgi:hypothetical protein